MPSTSANNTNCASSSPPSTMRSASSSGPVASPPPTQSDWAISNYDSRTTEAPAPQPETVKNISKLLPAMPTTDAHEPNGLIAARSVFGPLPIEKMVYDPALQHYPNGFKAKELPQDPDKRQAFLETKIDLMHEFLRQLQKSSLAESLVLRGSLCLHHWFPGQARPPGDLDFVARRKHLDTQIIIATLPSILSSLQAEGIQFGRIAEDAIWTYERVEGRRWTIPWQSPNHHGTIQVDITFDEPLPEEPESLEFSHRGCVVRVPCASRQLSLGWKLIWLESDRQPQGKDLYDAVLLAESVRMPELLHAELRKTAELDSFSLYELMDCDWANFLKEGAPTSDDLATWSQRLLTAVKHLENDISLNPQL